MTLLATLLLCITTAFARLELASDTPTTINTKLEEQSFLHAELAIACVRRSFELLHNKRQAHVLEERLSAFTCAVVHALLSFPAHTQLQLVGSHWLGWFGDRDAALAAGATQEMLRKRTVAR